MDKEHLREYLQSKDRTMVDYDNESFLAFLKKVGFSYKVPSIEITGSNGKSSVAAYLRGIYISNGYRVASFIKPSRTDLSGICVDMLPISEEEFYKLLQEDLKLIEKYGLTRFEIEVYIAFKWFMEQGVDLAIIEAGMGGEIDATNIYDPILSIITSISLEHTSFLGSTLGEIALNKSGIMRRLVPVLVGKLPEEADSVIIERSNSLNAPYHRSDDYHNEALTLDGATFDLRPYKALEIQAPSLGLIQDACIAIEATKILGGAFPVNEQAIRTGLKTTHISCRMQVEGHLIYDGAHNVGAITFLAESLQKLNLPAPYHVLFAAFSDKNIPAMLPILGKDAASLTLTTFDHPRAKKEDDYFLFIEDYPFIEDPFEALKKISEEHPEDYIVVTGSLAFAYLMEYEG